MNVDIDQFIRDQKLKIAEERSYIAKNSFVDKKNNLNNNINRKERNPLDSPILNDDNYILKMREGENMKNKYKQELRNEFFSTKQLDEEKESFSSKNEKVPSDDSCDEGLLYGMKYTNSASKRKEKVRNDEYNEFKAIEEAKFKNRFADKKNVSKRIIKNDSYVKSNPISNIEPISHSSSQNHFGIPSQDLSVVEYIPSNKNPKVFESKITDLERKVEELRNFRIQNPYIIYPQDNNNYSHRVDQMWSNVGKEGPNPMRYSNTNLGQSHLRYLEETEKRLRDIEDIYDRKKSDFMTNGKSGLKKLNPILDDEEMYTHGSFNSKLNFKMTANEQQPYTKSIIPTGRENNDELKKQKQEDYRRELQMQMKEKSSKSKTAENNNNSSFFDKFGQKEIPKKPEIYTINVEKDNDYNFYAAHNPLDEYDFNITPTFKGDYPLQLNDSQNLTRSNANKNDSNMFFGERDNQSNKGAYRNELIKQIEESKLRKEIEKKKLEDYERRKNEEIARYEPFGRGGGGAPLRNDKGETISDLKRIQFDPDLVKRDPPALKPDSVVRSEFLNHQNAEPPNSQRGFARGGNGIFGNALTDEDKVKAERYKEELKIQIERNKRQKEIDKENERIREENERLKFERDQKEIQIDLENEKKRQQEKELERQRLLEESKVTALKERERINNAKQVNENRINSTRIVNETKQEERIFSPIIRKQTPKYEKENLQDYSKLEIEAINRAQINREDSKIMSQIYKLKNQLENEKQRVERALLRQENEVEIYDPRLNKNNTLKNHNNNEEFNSDVFQAIVDNRKPQTVRRDHLKNKAVTPRKHKNTEAEYDEYIKQQEKRLERMYQNDFSKLELMMPKMEPKHIGLRPGTQMSNQLESDSAFLRFDQSNDFQLRNIQSQASDIDFHFTKSRSPRMSEFGSNTSLNIDELTRKNEQRIRKIQKLKDENDSNLSSEDILNNIVAKNNDDSDFYNSKYH